jgi:SagB-type dehydrogenase family enzyme
MSATPDEPAPAPFSLALIERAALDEDGEGALHVQTPPQAHRPPLRFARPSPGLRAALGRLAGEPATLPELAALVLGQDGPAGFAALQGVVVQLDRCALLSRGVDAGGSPLARLEPTSLYYRHDAERIMPGAPWILSRFVCCRRDGGRLIVESPLGHARVWLRSTAAATALGALAEPRTSAGLAEAVPGLDEPTAHALMTLLADAGALAARPDGQPFPEDDDPTLAQWEFHDLLFHARSRLGRHDSGFGGTYRFEGRFPPLPAVKPPMAEEFVELARPDLERLKREERPFSDVLEARRSVREQGESPIRLGQLGELLFRAARVQKMAEPAGVSFRPHPAGGAIHELEIYPVVHRCDGLDPGLYHYDASRHRLERLSAPARYLEALLQMAAVTAELKSPPQVLLVITARFQRIQWKYQSMAYSVILKNVGALYQTLYLVATAMGLAPCALGGGHADVFAAAAGLDYLAETSVGEFILGSARG